MPSLLISTTVPETLYFLLANQIPAFQKHGFTVSLISSPASAWVSAADVTSKYGIAVHEVGFTRTIAPFADIKALWRLIGIIRQTKPDIVHASTPKAALLTLIAAWLCRVPRRIYTVRGLVWNGKGVLGSFILRTMDRIACACAHQVISVSPSNRRDLIRYNVCPEQKVCILHNGSSQGVDALHKFNRSLVSPESIAKIKSDIESRIVSSLSLSTFQLPGSRAESRDNSQLSTSSSSPNLSTSSSLNSSNDSTIQQLNKSTSFLIGFLGRLVRDKGVEELTAAWQIVREKAPHTRLVIIGPPREPRDSISDATFAVLSNDPRVFLAGSTHHPEPWYASLDLLVHPSHREGFPNVVLEAAAMELPVITTDAPGCVDSVIDGETGYIVRTGNVPELADRMLQMVADHALCRKMGQKARERVLRDFNSEDITRELIKLYSLPSPSPVTGRGVGGENRV